MHVYLIGLVVSIGFFGALLALFRHEDRAGVRHLEGVRRHLDGAVVSVGRGMHRVLRLVGKDSLRQIMHYLLHTALGAVLYLNKRWEQTLRTMMRANKKLAQNAERERTTRTKLEELAMHKIANAMTDEEKKAHREKMLQGD